MKYVMLIHQGEGAVPGNEAWERALGGRAEAGVRRLQGDQPDARRRPRTTRGWIRRRPRPPSASRAARPLTTDGPFVSVKEALGGWLTYEADDLDAAIELASRIPAARLGGAIEIRPVSGGLLAILDQVFRDEWEPGPRQPDRLPRRLRARRGGRCRKRSRSRRSAGHGTGPRTTPGLAGDDGAKPGDQPDPARPHARREDQAARSARGPRRTRCRRHDDPDERLELIFTCCHPALALEEPGGADAADPRRPDDRGDRERLPGPRETMAKRLVRAKHKIEAAGIPFRVPRPTYCPTA